MIKIKIIEKSKYEETSKMIKESIENSLFSQFYPKYSTEYVIESLNAAGIQKSATKNNFYIAVENDTIVGCGAIGKKNKKIASLYHIFVAKNMQGKGIGTKIIKTLEKDELTKTCKKIEVIASMSAIPFYRKLGYEHKNGKLNYTDGQFILEKII